MPTAREYTATEMAKILNLTLARVGQMAKEGVIPKLANGRYREDAITAYINFLRATSEKKQSTFSVLLEEQKYREKKRENDIAEKLYAPVEVLERTVERGVAGMIPILETLPLLMKRNWPDITGDQIRLVKQSVAECRNVLADMEITLDD